MTDHEIPCDKKPRFSRQRISLFDLIDRDMLEHTVQYLLIAALYAEADPAHRRLTHLLQGREMDRVNPRRNHDFQTLIISFFDKVVADVANQLSICCKSIVLKIKYPYLPYVHEVIDLVLDLLHTKEANALAEHCMHSTKVALADTSPVGKNYSQRLSITANPVIPSIGAVEQRVKKVKRRDG